jgi:hypothetical protein
MAKATLSVEDKLAIHELLARYAWTFDTGDVEGFVGCFTPDAVLAEDAFAEPDRWNGSAEIRSMAEFFFSRPSFPGRQHHVSQVMIDGAGEPCRVRSFCFVTDCKGEPPYFVRFTGYYDDVVVKVADRWLFCERTIRDWSGPILGAFPGQTGVKIPRRRPPELTR